MASGLMGGYSYAETIKIYKNVSIINDPVKPR